AGFDEITIKGSLKFEARSESGEMVHQLGETIENIAAEVASHSGAEITMEVVAQREPGGIQFSHPLAVSARRILNHLDVKPRIRPSTSELSAFINKGIPAVTVGLSTGENLNEEGERIHIDPITIGLQQLLGLILAVDKGCCDED
ncbi:MAG: peptidase, partial [Spirochaetia bacterium]